MVPSCVDIRTHPGVQGCGCADGWTRARELCHDLRQPLAAILITSSSVAGSDVDARVREAMLRIQEQAAALVDMVRGALDETPAPQPVVVAGLVEDVVRVERITWPGRLEFIGPDEQSFDVAVVDPSAVRRAVANLIENAVRAAGADGLVRVRVDADRWVDVVIEDDGPGFGAISPGSGLGLDIVRGIVEGCGGSLDLSESTLGGVQVRLRLPVMEERAGLRAS